MLKLQELLELNKVSPGAIDGIFGPQTEQAVRTFQKKKKLTADGIAGQKTWAALKR
ncbi:peptidoglycan-binding protein [Alteribacillus sp. JSM 102045]|uniref:peptidoglycan-binding domain-containing protein n=1 Tax=Alteribacillus sp. JSM 102045 TaxID=1562101 RepID=UPI0035BECC58